MRINRTIVAQATPPGVGGLAVVRISGPEAFKVAGSIFKKLEKRENLKSHCAVYGILRSLTANKSGDYEPGLPIDGVLALPLIAPSSYTGEDTVEFFCHGGRYVVNSILEACRMAGACPAGPGEFSQQAFLNGRLSLDQTEAVADLIHADNEYAARAAFKQLRGGLNAEMMSIEAPLLELLSDLEGSLEFTEEEEVSVSLDEISALLGASLVQLNNLLSLAPAGRLLREGVQVVLAGPPNVGKSSLFNALLMESRALVDGEAGTTRDVISGEILRGKNLFVFHDTAGLREDAGRVEKMGIELTHRSIENADIVLVLKEAGSLSSDQLAGNDFPEKFTINVLTKGDLVTEVNSVNVPLDTISTSSIAGTGLDALWDRIEKCVTAYKLEQAVGMGVVLNERHKHKIQNSLNDLVSLSGEVDKMIARGLTHGGEEVIATMLSSLLSGLGEVSGRVFSEQLLGSVFQRFCVGK
jgi:tRNA modification GTPase